MRREREDEKGPVHEQEAAPDHPTLPLLGLETNIIENIHIYEIDEIGQEMQVRIEQQIEPAVAMHALTAEESLPTLVVLPPRSRDRFYVLLHPDADLQHDEDRPADMEVDHDRDGARQG